MQMKEPENIQPGMVILCRYDRSLNVYSTPSCHISTWLGQWRLEPAFVVAHARIKRSFVQDRFTVEDKMPTSRFMIITHKGLVGWITGLMEEHIYIMTGED